MAKRNSKDKIINKETEITKSENGKIISEKSKKTVLLSQEPNYIKLYLDTLLTFRTLPKQMSPLLFELLNLMTFANKEAKHGGQLIILNMFVKQEILERLNIKDNTFKKSLTAFVKSGILKRIGNSTYQANPEMFGRGEWSDIKAIRATFDFNAGTVEAVLEEEKIIDEEPLSFLERGAAGLLGGDDDDDEEEEEE
jgi:hypothetical protein